MVPSLRDEVTLRVESCSGLDRTEDFSRTFPSVLVPGLCDEVTLLGSRCIFLRTRSKRRLATSTYPRLLRDGVTLRVDCGLSSHSIVTKFSLDSWSVFLQDGVTLYGSGSHDLISSEGMPGVGLMGAFFQGRPRGESRHPLVGRYALRSGSVLHSGVFASCVDSVCPLSPTQEWVFDLLLLALSPLALPWWIGLLRRPHGDSFHLGVHALALPAWWLAGGSSRSRTSGTGLLAFCQGASESLPYPSPGCEVDASVFGITVRTLLQATPLPVAWNSPLRRSRDCPSLPLWVAALPLRFSHSEVSGPLVLLSYYVARVISRGPGILSGF